MLQTIPESKEFFTAADLATLLQINVMKVYRWRNDGKLVGVKLGHRTVRFHRDDVLQFLEDNIEKPAQEPKNGSD